ncbi:pnp [Gossypium arboreum]|uniref:Pnp n=1 Tax=Gossypium arboreum TaxID=29729 RepID=A0A0B0N0J7_GOSAR|nr:pnp [Gossypium arboreum]
MEAAAPRASLAEVSNGPGQFWPITQSMLKRKVQPSFGYSYVSKHLVLKLSLPPKTQRFH